ncbi:MAG: sterol carrier protein domain-containing protein [Gemmatimonadota bacterium]|nr:sterol carrier protein domain-containing protein [Gemmatimonadota bacterium]
MSPEATTRSGVTFRVLDAMDAPHRGRILRLRLQSGEAPSIKSLKGSVLRAVSPDGVECTIRVLGFALFGGKPSDERLARTGRVDVHVEELDDTGPVALRWEVFPT